MSVIDNLSSFNFGNYCVGDDFPCPWTPTTINYYRIPALPAPSKAAAIDLLMALEAFAAGYREGDVFAGKVRQAMDKLKDEVSKP